MINIYEPPKDKYILEYHYDWISLKNKIITLFSIKLDIPQGNLLNESVKFDTMVKHTQLDPIITFPRSYVKWI